MPATPAWPPASTPRLFVAQPLAAGLTVPIDGPAAHYLGNVMRVKPGDPIRLFDDVSGEWLAEAADVGKRRVTLAITAHLAAREAVPDLWLVAAPLKKGRIDWLAEKACELGVDRLIPVVTQRTVVDRPNLDRLRAHMIEAAEQCGRTALPAIDAALPLAKRLATWPADRQLLFADEGGGGLPMAAAARPGPAAILIGPEGGFTAEEAALIRAVSQATAITLGPRILRADTAAAAAVAQWMGIAGDWR